MLSDPISGWVQGIEVPLKGYSCEIIGAHWVKPADRRTSVLIVSSKRGYRIRCKLSLIVDIEKSPYLLPFY